MAGQQQVALNVSARRDRDELAVLVRLNPPPPAHERVPADICCVVDVSGSMGSEARVQNEEGEWVSHGLTLLDVAQHAVSSIIHTLGPRDRLSLITFSDAARKVFGLTRMDEQGKARAKAAMRNLDPDGNTNLWDGLSCGLEILRQEKSEDRLAALLLLTDGEPTVIPAGGHINALRQYQEQHENLPCSISTFGFGYDLDSGLLQSLASEGGSYAFIPDGAFVGTVFVHALSNLLSTAAQDLQLTLEPLNNTRILGFPGNPSHQTQSWGALLPLGCIQYGQTRDVVVRLSIPDGPGPYLAATLRSRAVGAAAPHSVSVECDNLEGGAELEVERLRLAFVDTVRGVVDTVAAEGCHAASVAIRDLCAEMRGSSVSADPRVVGLIADLEGQVTEALSRADWYTRWGQHYLRSLACAHALQQCNNFKDIGVQSYGGDMFRALRDAGDAAFLTLPPPRPSAPLHVGPAPRSMASYHRSDAPCFHGRCLVTMADGQGKQLDTLVKGDLVRTATGSSRVECVVRTPCPTGTALLVALPPGLLVTPWHPVATSSGWVFPSSLAPPQEVPCEAVYSLVLADRSSVVVGGVEAVTLGHGLDGPVVAHAFYGTERVVEVLAGASAWAEGRVELPPGCVVRSPRTGLVVGLNLE